MVTKYEAAERGARQGRGRGKERPNNSRKRGRAEKAGKIKGGRAGGGGGAGWAMNAAPGIGTFFLQSTFLTKRWLKGV